MLTMKPRDAKSGPLMPDLELLFSAAILAKNPQLSFTKPHNQNTLDKPSVPLRYAFRSGVSPGSRIIVALHLLPR